MIYWRCPKTIAKNFLNWYIDFLLKSPTIFLSTSFLFSLLLTFTGLYFHISGFSVDPRKGFETRGTPLSEKRLALEAFTNLAKPVSELIQASVLRKVLRKKRNAEGKVVFLNSTSEVTEGNEESTTMFTIDYEDYGVNDRRLGIHDITSACEQYYAMGKFIPYESLEYLSKAIFEVDSFDKLFTLKVMQRLCRLDALIESVPSVKNFLTPLPFSFNLPLYVMCVDSRQKSCDELTQTSIDDFREQIELCVQSPESPTCLTGIAQQLKNHILQKMPLDLLKKNVTILQGKFYIGAILRVRLASYDTIQSQIFYRDLLDILQEEYALDTDIALVGLNINAREIFFEDEIYTDTLKASMAVGIVALIICCYCCSLLFTLIVMIGMFLCLGVAFFLYSTVFGFAFFPFINFLAIVVAIAIGADDAFLITFQYEQAKKEIEDCMAKSSNIHHNHFLQNCSCRRSYCYYSFVSSRFQRSDKSADYNGLAMRSALSHAIGAMFVTSATTAVAFLTNCFSDILVLRCFGAFSCLAVIFNYLFAISALPASLLLLDKFKYSSKDRFPKFNLASFMKPIADFYIYKSPSLFYRCKHLINIIAFLLKIIFVISILNKPGIKLPEHNPLQLLRSSHPFEWFAEYEKILFNFSDHTDRQLNFYVLWGVEEVRDASRSNPENPGKLKLDKNFKLQSWSDFKSLEYCVKTVLSSGVVKLELQNTSNIWISEFLNWAQGLESKDFCKIEETTKTYDLDCYQRYIDLSKKVSQLPNDFTQLFEDSPVFHRITQELIGYFLIAPSRYKFSLLFAKIEPLMKDITLLETKLEDHNNISSVFKSPLILPVAYVSTLFDLLQSLLHGTSVSIAISLLICAAVISLVTRSLILSLASILNIALIILGVTTCILWLGWTVNIVEATILVITIGLSFDYTLHLAVAFKYAPDVFSTQKLVHANEAVTVPIFLAMTTNVGAGLVLLTSSTQPFYEIGVFLLILAAVSYVTTIFIFPSFLLTLRQIKAII